jgi:hypothetical protein
MHGPVTVSELMALAVWNQPGIKGRVMIMSYEKEKEIPL